MEFRIADSFTGSLARLTGDEQKAAKTTAFDLQMDPSNPGLSFHKLDGAKDKNFWSVRVSRDLRLIVHKTENNLLLCYVDHHDKAYAWAERRKLETHPKTRAVQWVVIKERSQEILRVHREVEAPRAAKPPLFSHLTDDELLAFGVPPEWLPEVRKATEDTYLDLADQLPAEASEALLEIAVGETPRPRPVTVGLDPFEHPDAQRRFRLVHDVEELQRALEYPWEKWTTFLHPAQRELVGRKFGGPARIAGSAGTGKTIVALHRAASLARQNPDARILLTTFSDTLASSLRIKLGRLIGTEPRVAEGIDVDSLDGVAQRLFEKTFGGSARLVSSEELRAIVEEAMRESPDQKFSFNFVLNEWDEVVDAWQLASWDAYRDVARLGRKTRLPEKQRQILWTIFELVRSTLSARGLITRADVYSRLSGHYNTEGKPPYDFVVVDEAQDVSVPQMRFIASLGHGRPDALFFAGDLGQRIFQLPFSWKSLGVDIRGRSGTLRVNYRTSHQIRMQADRLLGAQVSDVDGNAERRTGTVSVFNGPSPEVEAYDTPEAEITGVAGWLRSRISDGVKPEEIGVFVRSEAQLPRAESAVRSGGLQSTLLRNDVKTSRDHVSIGTMHLSKGLEFRAVTVMACDDEILPLQERIESVTDDSDLEEVYDTERHLLYVACTRARDYLFVSGVNPVSEFLADLQPKSNSTSGAKNG